MSELFEDYLTTEEVEHIRTHKYVTTGYSWLDKKINPFWEICANRLPYNLTPNKVTCLGGIALYTGVIALAFYDITFTETLPTWVYWHFVLALFLGQTLDAIDGKHARNTKRGSPLGQLMDHSCDAITNSCYCIFIAQSFRMGLSPTSLIATQVFVHVTFFIATWQENATGILSTHVNNLGVTEVQFLAMSLCLMGTSSKIVDFLTSSFIGTISYSDMAVYFCCIVLSITASLYTIIKVLSNVKPSDYAKTLSPYLNLVLMVTCEVLISYFENYRDYLLYYIVLNGLFFGIMISKLIMNTMSGRRFTIPCFEGVMFLLSILLALYVPALEVAISIAQGVFIVLYNVFYYGRIVKQLMRELKIAVF